MSKELVHPARFQYVTTRKNHACEGCGNIIQKGSTSLNVHGRLGTWFNEYYCWSCDIDRIESIPDEKLRKKLFDEKARLQVSGKFIVLRKTT